MEVYIDPFSSDNESLTATHILIEHLPKASARSGMGGSSDTSSYRRKRKTAGGWATSSHGSNCRTKRSSRRRDLAHPSWFTTSTYCVERDEEEDEIPLPSSASGPARARPPSPFSAGHSSLTVSSSPYVVVEGPCHTMELTATVTAHQGSGGPSRNHALTQSPLHCGASSYECGDIPASRSTQRVVPPPTPKISMAPNSRLLSSSSVSSTLPPYVLKSKKLRRKIQHPSSSEVIEETQGRGLGHRSFSATVEALASKAQKAQPFFNAELPSRPQVPHSYYISPIHQRVAEAEDPNSRRAALAPVRPSDRLPRKRRANEVCSQSSESSSRASRRRRRRLEEVHSPVMHALPAPSLLLPPLMLPPTRTGITERERQLEQLFGAAGMEEDDTMDTPFWS